MREHMTEFERGVRAGVEALTMYFQDENGYSIHAELSDTELASSAEGAIRDALRDESLTNSYLDRRPRSREVDFSEFRGLGPGGERLI